MCATLLLPFPALADPFDESEYVVPHLEACQDHSALPVGSGCAWAWSEVEALFGFDSRSQDTIFGLEGSAGVVVRQDFGATGLEVGATLADQFAVASWDVDYEQTLRLDNASLKLAGEDWLVSIGRQKSIANFYDDEPLTNLLLYGESPDATLSYYSPVGGHGVRVFVGDQQGWSAGIGFEALGQAPWSNFKQPEGTLVGVVNFADETVTAHSTVLFSGLLEEEQHQTVATHSGFTAQIGTAALVAALATEYDRDTGEQSD